MKLYEFFQSTYEGQSILTEMIVRHRAYNPEIVVAFQDSIWILSSEQAYNGDEDDPVLQDIQDRIGIEFDTDDVVNSITDNYPDVFVAHYDEPRNILTANETYTRVHPSTSKLIRKVVQELDYPRVIMANYEFDDAGNPDDIETALPAEEIRGDLPDMVYHGTSDTYLPSIARIGLTPGQGQSNWAKLGIIHDKLVFVATTPQQAMFHATNAIKSVGGKPIVLKFKIPDRNRIVPDYDVATDMIGVDEITNKTGYTRMPNFGHHANIASNVRSRNPRNNAWEGTGVFGYSGRIPASYLMELIGLQPEYRTEYAYDEVGFTNDNIQRYRSVQEYYSSVQEFEDEYQDELDAELENESVNRGGYSLLETAIYEHDDAHEYWITDTGNILDVGNQTHLDVAEEFFTTDNPELSAVKRGWIRVSALDGTFTTHWESPTKKGLRILIKMVDDLPDFPSYRFGKLDIIHDKQIASNWLRQNLRTAMRLGESDGDSPSDRYYSTHRAYTLAWNDYQKNPNDVTGKALKKAQNDFKIAKQSYDEEFEREKAHRVKSRQGISDEHEYRGQHSAPSREDAPLHDLTINGIYPDDFYGPKGLRYYASDTPSLYHFVCGFKGRPKRSLKVYRAVPKNVGKVKIVPGDWVTISLTYAKNHGKENLKNDFRIISKTVLAKDLFTDGNSLEEWGWNPDTA